MKQYIPFLLTILLTSSTFAQTTQPSPVPAVQSVYDQYVQDRVALSATIAQLSTSQAQSTIQLSTISAQQQSITSLQSTIIDLQSKVGQLQSPLIADWFVSADGNDSGPGSSTLPFKTIQHAITQASISKPTIAALPGTYSEHLIFHDSITLRGLGSVIIDGRNALPILAESGQHVIISHIRFTNALSPSLSGAVKPNSYWLVEDCEIDHCSQAATDTHGTQINHVHDVILRRVIADHNGAEGFKGGWCDSVVEDHCESAFNNTSNVSVLNEGGGGKYLYTNGLSFLSCWYHDNNGAGLWLDTHNKNYLISDLYSSGNKGSSGMGIGCVIEISEGPGIITRYHASGNGNSDLGLFESSNIIVTDSHINSYVRFAPEQGMIPSRITFNNCVGGIPTNVP